MRDFVLALILVLINLHANLSVAQSDHCSLEAVLSSFQLAAQTNTLDSWTGNYAQEDCEPNVMTAVMVLNETIDLLDDLPQDVLSDHCSIRAFFTSFEYARLSDSLDTWFDVYSRTDCSEPLPQAVENINTAYRLLSGEYIENLIFLTRLRPSVEASGTLTAPQRPAQNYTLFNIDTTDFTNGGTLMITVQLGNGESGGSYDLFPEGFPVPQTGRPDGTLVGEYDRSPGSVTRLQHEFEQGEIFQFGLTGNWFSRAGSTNTFTFTVSVQESE